MKRKRRKKSKKRLKRERRSTKRRKLFELRRMDGRVDWKEENVVT